MHATEYCIKSKNTYYLLKDKNTQKYDSNIHNIYCINFAGEKYRITARNILRWKPLTCSVFPAEWHALEQCSAYAQPVGYQRIFRETRKLQNSATKQMTRTITITTTSSIGVCLTGLFFQRSLQVSPEAKPLEIACVRFFPGWMPFMSHNQQFQNEPHKMQIIQTILFVCLLGV